MSVASPRLAGLARPRGAAVQEGAGKEVVERCELCSAALPERHRHLLDLDTRELQCTCRACALLFDRPAAGGEHLRLVPEGVRRPATAVLDDAAWSGLGIPVGLAFFFRSTRADPPDRVVAAYPGPAGATESLLGLEAFPAEHPSVAALAPDVQALLVNRARGANEEFIVGIDACYGLVGLIRTGWRGFGGGQEVWAAIAKFFDAIRKEAR